MVREATERMKSYIQKKDSATCDSPTLIPLFSSFEWDSRYYGKLTCKVSIPTNLYGYTKSVMALVIGFQIIHRTPAAIDPPAPPDLTVVIPVSNTAPYLQACLDSLTVQGNLALELILVDYRSTDGSREMALKYARQFPDLNIVIADQTQGGLGGVRNFGIEIATGAFITFLDSDDLVTPDIYPRMLRFAETHNCDLVICKNIQFQHSTKISTLSHALWSWNDILGNKACLVTNIRRTPRLLEIELTAANRVIRLDFMKKNKIFGPENKHHEDFLPHVKMMLLAKQVGLINVVGCFKREDRVGQMTVARGKVKFDALDAFDSVLDEIESFQPDTQFGPPVISIFIRAVQFGGGCLIYSRDRREFYGRAVAQYARFPRSWTRRAMRDWRPHLFYRTLVSAFASKDVTLLSSLAAWKPSGIRSLIHFARRGEFEYIWHKRKDIAGRIRNNERF